MTQLLAVADKPVLVCVDLGPHSAQAMANALSLACDENRPLVVLHVVHETGESAGFYRHQNRQNETTPLADIATTLLEELVDKVVGCSKPNGCSVGVATRVVEGIPANRIAEVAELLDAEIVVLVGSARSAIGRFWHGSVAAGVRR